jgi:hypothetical protein
MRRLMRRFGAGQRHQLGRLSGRDPRLARLAGLVAQQTFNPHLGEALLPPPHRRPADADAVGNPLCRFPIGRGQHDARPLDVLARSIAIGRDRRQLLTLHCAQNHAYLLCHGPHSPKP